jgi:hypothetical protein
MDTQDFRSLQEAYMKVYDNELDEGAAGDVAARRAAALKKEEFELWVNSLVEEGYDLSDYTWDEMYGVLS